MVVYSGLVNLEECKVNFEFKANLSGGLVVVWI
jgi:hypothetical protein